MTYFLCCALLVSGCTVWADAKVVSWKDSVAEGDVTQDWNTVLNQLISYLQTQGQVKKVQAGHGKGLIEVWIQGSKVEVNMDQTKTDTVHLSVSAKKNGAPQVELAHDVYTGATQRLNQNP